jgi:hypothetical protein
LIPSNAKVTIVFAGPYLLLLTATISSWPWKVFSLPWLIGGTSPFAIVFLFLTVWGGIWAMNRRLPPQYFTWPPAALGATIFLTIGIATQTLDPEASLALILGYAIVFGFVWIVSLALAKYGVSYAIGFTCLFLITQGIQIQTFENSPVSDSWKPILTLLSSLRATGETFAIVWLAHRLVIKVNTSSTIAAWGMVGLVALHGPLSTWEQLLRINPTITMNEFIAASEVWLLFCGPLLGIVAVSARLRRGWIQEPPTEAVAKYSTASNK